MMKAFKLLAMAAALFAVYGFARVADDASGVGQDRGRPAAVDRKVDGVSSASRKRRKHSRKAPADVQRKAGA